ncbi:MAG: 2-hydroxychromene-2-carboxylate isomerase [Devosia sp.]
MALTFWYDFASSYSYLTAMRFEEAAQKAGVAATWRPFLLGPIFQDAGYDGSPNLVAPSKAAYMWRDIKRRAESRGIDFFKPYVFPQRSVAACRAAIAVSEADRPALTRAIFTQSFGQNRDIADLEVIAEAARQAGLDADAVVAGTKDGAVKQALFDNVARAKEIGIFGAPSFETSDGELFWGDDRLDDALAWEKTGSLPGGR